MIDHKEVLQRNFKKVEQSVNSLVIEKEQIIRTDKKPDQAMSDLADCERLIMRFERALEIVCNIFFRAIEMAEYGTLSQDTRSCIAKMKELSLITSEDIWMRMIQNLSGLSPPEIPGTRTNVCHDILHHYVDELSKFCVHARAKFGFS